MHRTIFIYSTILTLLATTHSKSVKNDEEIESTTSERLATTVDLPVIYEPETDEKQSAKRSLLILMPVDEKRKPHTDTETQDIVRKNQKTKRCKTTSCRERGSSSILGERTNQDILGSRHMHSYNDERATKYLANQKPRLQLVPLKKSDTAAKRDPTLRENEEHAADRGNNNVMKAIRGKLQSKNYNVGASRGSFLRKTIDDDEYVCYCREKNNPAFRKNVDQDFVPKPSPSELLARRLKPQRNNNDKLLRESRLRQNQIYRKPQHQPFLHALYPDTRQYLSTLLPNHMSPILQQKGHEKVPYVPYFYQIEPELAVLPEMIHSDDPTKVNVPIDPVSGSPDSIVGQPNRGHHLQNNQQVGQRVPSPNVARKPSTSSNPYSITNTLKDPYYSTKIDEGSTKKGECREDPNVSDYNLQSGHSKFPKYTTLTSIDGGDHTNSVGISGDDAEVGMEKGKEMSSEDPLRATNSAMGDNAFETSSSNDSKTDFSSEHETTDRGTADYSEIRGVTNAYYETNGYSDDRGASSFDKFYTHGGGSTSPVGTLDYDANVESRLNPTTQTLMGSDEIATEMGKSSDEEQQSSPSEDIEYQSSPNDASYFRNEAKKHPQEGNVVGKGNPLGEGQAFAIDSNENNAMQPDSNDPNYHKDKGFGNAEGTSLITVCLTSPNEAGVSRKIDDKGNRSGEEFFKENRPSESPEMEDNGGPLRNDYGEENFESDKQQEKSQYPNEKDEEKDPAGESSMDETMGSVDPESDSGMAEDTINMDDNEKSMLNSGIVGAERAINPSEQNLPFCDNALLQKAIKTVINNFATNPIVEEKASSTDDELLREVLNVPNLRNIVSMPPIERTILGKVKNLLARVTGVPRTSFDGDWPTNVIRDNLRNTMAAAPASNGELPPMTVAEHQFKDGKWITNLVTLEPTPKLTVRPPSVLERLQAAVKSLLRDPAVGLQAAKQPTVQNMIVQSVQKTFKPEHATSNEVFDESVVQAALDKELSLMEMEDTDAATIGTKTESDTMDITNMDMNKSEAGINDDVKGISTLVNSNKGTSIGSPADGNSPVTSIFKEEGTNGEASDASDVVNKMQSESRPDKEKLEKVASLYWKDVSLEDAGEKRMTNSAETSGTSTSIKLLCEGNVETISPTTESFSYDLVGRARNSELKQHLESSSTEAIVRSTVQTDQVTEALKGKETPKAGKGLGNRELESTSGAEKLSGTSKYKSISPKTPCNIVAAARTSQDENREESTGGGSSSFDDETYLGRISVKKNNNYPDDVQSLQNSELYYVGDGVKLPLEIRKLDDGSYALSISRKVCEQLLDKKCPCCVPVEGHVVRTVRTNAETGDAERIIGTSRRTKRISKRESFKSILPGEREKYDSAGDSLQIFSMPVETFARRYNLSLNLEKVQAPWNFEAKQKIDERLYSRAKNSQNKESNADANCRHDLFSVHGIPENGNSDVMVRVQRRDDHLDEDSDVKDSKYRSRRQRQRNSNTYRYERNIDEPVNKRAEIVKDVLHWLREMILHIRSE